MKYSEVQTMLESYVQTNVTGITIAFENAEFDPTNLTKWLRVTIQFGNSQLRSLGTRCFRVAGIMMCEIFIRPAVGIVDITTFADTLTDLFKGSKIVPALSADPTVNFLEPQLTKFPAEQSGWIRGQVTCPFYYDLEA